MVMGGMCGEFSSQSKHLSILILVDPEIVL
jgi:hypothetical protein